MNSTGTPRLIGAHFALVNIRWTKPTGRPATGAARHREGPRRPGACCGNPNTMASRPMLYSLNFNWGTMDRTWRWRTLPAAPQYFDVQAGNEPIPANPGECVYPQTIRLREDMTIHLKGTHQGVPGRWYQRYLPANNQLIPPSEQLQPNQRPQSGYAHTWKFLPESASITSTSSAILVSMIPLTPERSTTL